MTDNWALLTSTAIIRNALRCSTTLNVRTLVWCLLASLPPAALAQTSGLISAYSFNEGAGTVTDVSGNSNNGAISNGTWSASGRYGAALSFNGSTSRVDIPDSASLDLTTGMTMEAWVQPNHVERLAHGPHEGAERGSGVWPLCQ